MEFDPLIRAEDLIRERHDELRRALRRRPLPIVVLDGPVGLPPGRLGGWESFNDVVTCLHITYGGADRPGPWVTVETARWAGTTVLPGSLREMLQDHMRLLEDRFSAVEWSGERRSISVDGHTVEGRLVRAGDRWWALRCSVRDLEISVVAHDWHAAVAVRTIAEPELRGLIAAVPVPPRLPVPDVPEAGEIYGEPHRQLIDGILRSDREQAEWMADGGPAPRPVANWPELWEATLRRQAELSGQPAEEANRSVQSMLNQLTNLQHEATWFREDAALRERAINETLLYGTGLSQDVPSRAAQVAWLGQAGTATRGDWLAAWQDWVRSIG